MRRKFSWPFVALITFSFAIGAFFGLKLLRDRAKAEGRLESEAKLRILAPPGIFSKEILTEFQRREKIEVELSTETFPASLLRRALKSPPGTYDAVLVFHYQVSALRSERKLAGLYDTKVKFPTSIAPDFRKLPNDRNLMDTAPLLWGLLGTATKKEFERGKMRVGFWPSLLIGLEDSAVLSNVFAMKMQPALGSFESLEEEMKKGLGGFTVPPSVPALISHGSLSFSPLKESGLSFEPLHETRAGGREIYPMWILTLVALNEGDLDRTRRFVKFLLDPAQNTALIQHVRAAASTLRDQNELEVLPKELRPAYLRNFSLDKISLERDERVRGADEVLEQLVLGAGAKISKSIEPVKTPSSELHSAVHLADHLVADRPIDRRAERSVAKKKVAPVKPVETSGDEESDDASVDLSPPAAADAAPPTLPVTAPSEDSAHVD